MYDSLHFELGFPSCTRPMLITLTKDIEHPFQPHPQFGDTNGEGNGSNDKSDNKEKPPLIKIDFTGIQQRVVAFPYPEGNYSSIRGIPSKAIFIEYPKGTALRSTGNDPASAPKPKLHAYNFKEHKKEGRPLVMSRDGKVVWMKAEELEAEIAARGATR